MSTPHIKMVNSVYELKSGYNHFPHPQGDPQPVYLGVGPNMVPEITGGVFLQVQIGDPKGYGKASGMTQVVKVMPEDVDDLITALQYCKERALGNVPQIGGMK